MPQYELAVSGLAAQLFPGEAENAWAGEGSAGGNGLKGAICIPADYYSNPEVYQYEDNPCLWTYTEERRASPALYDYRGQDDYTEPFRMDNVDGIPNIVFGPRTWRSIMIWWAEEVQVSVPSGNAFPFMLRLMGIGS